MKERKDCGSSIGSSSPALRAVEAQARLSMLEAEIRFRYSHDRIKGTLRDSVILWVLSVGAAAAVLTCNALTSAQETPPKVVVTPTILPTPTISS